MNSVVTRGAIVTATSLALTANLPAAAQTAREFYKGKTVQFSLGYPPASGLDVYTRAARATSANTPRRVN